jgi:hypothetical protein
LQKIVVFFVFLSENKDYVYDSHRQPSWNLGYRKELFFAVIFITNSILGNCRNPDVQAPKEMLQKRRKSIKSRLKMAKITWLQEVVFLD